MQVKNYLKLLSPRVNSTMIELSLGKNFARKFTNYGNKQLKLTQFIDPKPVFQNKEFCRSQYQFSKPRLPFIVLVCGFKQINGIANRGNALFRVVKGCTTLKVVRNAISIPLLIIPDAPQLKDDESQSCTTFAPRR